MHMPKSSDTNFAPPPEGTLIAVCYRVIDLGTQLTEFQGEQKKQRKVLISWELNTEETMDDGKPFTIHKRYTLSSHKKSNLRADLESWRGKKFEDSDFGPGGFDIERVLGAGCLLNIVHSHKDGNTYANIAAIVALPKGTVTPPLINTPVYLDLDDFNQAVFDSLSEGLRETIRKSPEYAKIGNKPVHRQNTQPQGEPSHDEPYHDGMDDKVPF